MNLGMAILGGIFVLLVIAHFILWGSLKSYFKKSHPADWEEYKKPVLYKILPLSKGIINLRFGYFIQFAETHESLARDINIKKRITLLRWIHGITAVIGIIIVLAIVFLYRPY